MKKLIVFCLLVMAFCFCNHKKNANDNTDEAANVSADSVSEQIDNSHDVSADSGLGSLRVGDEIDTATLQWISAWGEVISSKIRKLFKDPDNNEDFVAVNAILQNHVKLVGRGWDVVQASEDGDINYFIKYKDDNYISFSFGGVVFTGAHPTPFICPVIVDIKNKKTLALKDIVKIDTPFVNAAYKYLLEFNDPDEDGSCSYSIENLKEDLLETNVLDESKQHMSSNVCYFDEKDLMIDLWSLRPFSIVLPLSKIRSMVILPNFPTGSE
jgi:hypothetical protein